MKQETSHGQMAHRLLPGAAQEPAMDHHIHLQQLLVHVADQRRATRPGSPHARRIDEPQRHAMLYCLYIYCILLYCIVLYYIISYHIISYYIILYYIIFCFYLFYCIVLYCIVLYCIVLYCIVLYCIVLYCIVLYCIILLKALPRRASLLRCSWSLASSCVARVQSKLLTAAV